MDKKKIIIVAVGIAVGAISYFFHVDVKEYVCGAPAAEAQAK